ncbi:MAG TPA: hypothetical protein VII94_02565 [Candidatus Saccharimonadales bacterium]
MSPIDASILRPEYLPNLINDPGSREKKLEQLYEMAPDYYADLIAAQNHDDNRPARPKEVPYQQWLEDNPRKRSLVEAEWNNKLNIINTNNFYMWFRDSDELIGHKIDDPDSLDTKPALKDLIKLRNDDPELFVVCGEVANEKLRYTRIDVNQNGEERTQEEQYQHTIDNIVVTWVCELYMEQIVTRLINAGLSADEISTLF